MSLIRKALWPTAIALGFLVFLGALGQGNVVRTAFAHSVCAVESTATVDDLDANEYIMSVDTTEDFTVWYEGDEEGNFVDVDLDDESGDSDITSEFGDDIPNTDFFNIDPRLDDNVCGDTDAELLADLYDEILDTLLAAVEDGEPCSDPGGVTTCPPPSPPDDNDGDTGCPPGDGSPGCEGDDSFPYAFNDADVDCGFADVFGGPCVISAAIIKAAANAIADGLFDGDDCGDIQDAIADAVLLAAAGNDNVDAEFAAAQFVDFFQDVLCGEFDVDFEEDSYVTVDVTCNDAGKFELSFSPEDGGETVQFTVTCVGPVDEILLTADPNKIEIVPAMGSVSYSLIIANLIDEDLNAVLPPEGVDFKTNRCVFQDEDGLTSAEFDSVKKLFDDYNVNDAQSALDLTAAVKAIDHDDPDDDSNQVKAFMLSADAGNENLSDIDNGDAIAAIILDCTAFNTVPGVATITAEVDQDGVDIIKTTTVTVVGPPASPVAVAADQASVICGDRVQITVTVRDSAGQAVSDHTLVEAVTTFGGVLGGTGAVAGNLGFVVPVSSTLSETFNGVATFFLLTSDTHVGPYDVTIATGGGGSVTGALGGFFSTPVQVGRVSVSCTQPVVAPAVTATVTAPRTGQGIVPPNTGDAGLAASSESGLSLLVIAGVVAFALAGVASLKFARR